MRNVRKMLSGHGGDFQSLRWHRMDILILPNKERSECSEYFILTDTPFQYKFQRN